MTNLLIGYVTGDFLQKLIDESDKWLFESKVELILQNSYMFQRKFKDYSDKKLKDFKIWHSMLDENIFSDVRVTCCNIIFCGLIVVCGIVLLGLCWPLFCCWYWCGQEFREDLFRSDMENLKARHIEVLGVGKIKRSINTESVKDEMEEKINKMKNVIDKIEKSQANMEKNIERLLDMNSEAHNGGRNEEN